MPIPILLIAALASAAISEARSIKQAKEAKAMEADNERPNEVIPQGVKDATAVSRLMSMVGMPEAQYVQQQRDINRNSANTLAGARDRRGGLDVASIVQQQSDDATLNLNAKDAEFKQQNLVNYIRQLSAEGEWQDKIWSWNNAQKFQENAAAIRALKTASQANQGNAVNSILSAAVTYASDNVNNNNAGNGVVTGDNNTSSADLSTRQIGAGYTTNSNLRPESMRPISDPTITNPKAFDYTAPNSLYNYIQAIKSN